jgi:DNA-binding IclR family transcriptional regulator
MVKDILNHNLVDNGRFTGKNFDLKNILDQTDEEQPDMIQIHRASKVITCISNGVNTLSDIGDYCELSKSSAHRLLKALEKSNFIMYNSFTRQYLIGQLITDIALKPETYHDYLNICAGKELEELAESTEETIILLVMVGLRQVKIRSILSKHDLRVSDGSRKSVGIFAGAGSQVLLSQLKDDELKIALNSLKMDKITDRTIINKKALLARIRKIRRQGYAMTCGERLSGVICLAAPINNYVLPTALTIIGPQNRVKGKSAGFIDLLLHASNRISANILDIYQS